MTARCADAIVVAYGSADVLPACVESLRRDPAVDRVIVVNNSPGDGARMAVQEFERMIYLESVGNVGFSRAVNRASCFVAKDFVAIVNPDAFQSRNTVTAAVDFLQKRPSAALVGPRFLRSDGSVYCSSMRSMSLVRMLAEHFGHPARLRLSRPRSAHHTAHETPYVIGSFIVCRRVALDAVEWFNESIFLFGEDQDLCRRLRRSGWQVWYAPVGAVEHLSGHSWRQLSDEGRRAFREARVRELKAERGMIEVTLFRILCVVSDAVAALLRAMRAYVDPLISSVTPASLRSRKKMESG